MNSLGLGRYVNTFGLGVPYAGEVIVEEPSGGGGGKGKDRQDNWRDIQRQKQHELILREDEELTMLIKTILTKGLI